MSVCVYGMCVSVCIYVFLCVCLCVRMYICVCMYIRTVQYVHIILLHYAGMCVYLGWAIFQCITHIAIARCAIINIADILHMSVILHMQ